MADIIAIEAVDSEAYFRQGEERLDNDALRKGIQISQKMLRQIPKEQVAVREMTVENLGSQLLLLGEQTGNLGFLKEAEQYLQNFVSDAQQQGKDLAAASGRFSLAGILLARSRIIGDQEALLRAIEILNSVATEDIRSSLPELWAEANTNLCNAFETLAGQRMDLKVAKDAIYACGKAREMYDQKTQPVRWAELTSRVANIKSTLGR